MADVSSLPQPGVDGYSYLKPPTNKAGIEPINKSVLGTITLAEKADGINRTNNVHSAPPKPIYPKPGPSDVEFTIKREATLRGAMYFPKTWEANKAKQPVILVPPTGLYGGTAYEHNLAKLLTDWSVTNPMWLNVPGAMADWTWRNAEFVAYAIHYVYQRTGKKVALIAWSQGNLASQWALTWWPSTRALVNNFISISADFHGTLTAYITGFALTAPSILSQRYYSQLITALREKGGDSSWVPHTSIYSSWVDEVVQPQFLLPGVFHPSAYIKNAHKAGVTNVDVFTELSLKNLKNSKETQVVWYHGKPGQVNVEKKTSITTFDTGGYFYGHGGLVLHPLVWAIIKDAISKGGPAQLSRFDTKAATSLRWNQELTKEERRKSWWIMGKFIPNLLNWPLFSMKIFESLAPYAHSEATKKLAILDSQKKIPPLSAEEQKIVNHARDYSRRYTKPDDPKTKILIPSMFCLETCLQQSEIQMETGKPMKVPPCPIPRGTKTG